MNERLQYEGHLSMLKRQRQALETQIAGLVKSLRENLDILTRPEKLKTDIIFGQAIEMKAKQSDLHEILHDMEMIYDLYPELKDR